MERVMQIILHCEIRSRISEMREEIEEALQHIQQIADEAEERWKNYAISQ